MTSAKMHISPERYRQVAAFIQNLYPDCASRMASYVGGGALRTLLMLHAAGIRVRYYGAAGSDATGYAIGSHLEKAGIEHCLQRYDGITAVILYITYLDGSNTIYESMCAPGVSQKLLFTIPVDAEHMYVEGYLGESTQVWSELHGFLQRAPHDIRFGTTVMIDVGNTAAAQRATALCAAYTQEQIILILCGTEDELLAVHAIATRESLIDKGIILITKHAERGASVQAREGSWHHPSLADNAAGHKCVGAGDAFSAGFLACMLAAAADERRSPGVLQESLAQGNAYAAQHIAAGS